MNLKSLSLILSLVGILLLAVLLSFSSPIKITSPEQLKNLTDNQKVLIEGQVIKQTSSYLTLNNNLTIQCSSSSCPSSLKDKNISALCYFEKYENRDYLKILRIKILE